MQRARLLGIGAVVLISFGACSAVGPDPQAADYRARLSRAMQARVTTRDQRDAHSRLLVEALDHRALEGLDADQVRAAFGVGETCAGQSLCAQQGFTNDDLYYPIGELGEDSVKQLPVLLVGFDSHGRVDRVWSLRTH